MSKDKRKARELVEADVGYISLVGRGANGEPFRVVKSEDGMSINLSGIFPIKKAAPAIAFVAIAKGYDLEQAKQVLTDNGLSVEDVQDTEEATIFKQSDFDTDAVELLQVSESVVVGIVGADVKKMFEDINYSSTSFKEVISQAGAMPMIYMAKMALGDTIQNIMRQAGDRGETVDLVKSAITDFGAFVEGVLKQVPETAFKMDVALGDTPIRKSDEAPAATEITDAPEDDASATNSSDEGPDEVEKGGKGKKKPYKDDDADDDASKMGGKGKKKKSDEDDSDDDSSAGQETDPALEALTGLVKGLGDQIQKSQESTDKRLEDLNTAISSVTSRVEKAESALSGTLVGGEEPDEVVKSDSDDDEDTGFSSFDTLDTAYSDPFRSQK